jgi:hypothetical protein
LNNLEPATKFYFSESIFKLTLLAFESISALAVIVLDVMIKQQAKITQQDANASSETTTKDKIEKVCGANSGLAWERSLNITDKHIANINGKQYSRIHLSHIWLKQIFTYTEAVNTNTPCTKDRPDYRIYWIFT